MNFTFSEDQIAIRESVERIFTDLCDDDSIKRLSKSGQPTHTKLWAQLAETGILGLPISEDLGGMGMGLVELCQIIELQGRSVASIPLISTVVESAMTIADSDNDDLKQRVMADVIGGQMLISPARPYTGLQAGEPLVIQQDSLNGRSGFVPYAGLAQGYLVEAGSVEHGCVLLFCPSDAEGLEVVEQTAISDEPAGYLRFNKTQIDSLNLIAKGDAAKQLIDMQKHRTWVALAALQVGALDEGLKRTASYVSERKQFGRALGSFQAVSQQAANAYMEIESLRSVYWRALDDIESGVDFSVAAAVAKYWVAEAGHQAAHTVLHLHGGIGQDLDYPIHRYFLFAKQCERYLGGADEVSALLGKQLMQVESARLEQLCL